MPSHIEILVSLTDLSLELDELQGWVDDARTAAPNNQVVQLSLDRQQSDIDLKREFIRLAMLDIASRN